MHTVWLSVPDPEVRVIVLSELTVSCWYLLTVPPHPPVIVYVMLDDPCPMAVTNPDDGFTVATLVLVLLHDPVPPPSSTVLAVYVAELPVQRGVVPDIEPMLALGVTVIVLLAQEVLLQSPSALT